MNALRLPYLTASLLFCGGFVAPVSAQQSTPAFTVTMGAGNAFGGVGLGGEAYAFRGHVSLLAGAGVFVASPGTDPIIGAMALRYHVGGSRHSAYAGISWTYLTLYGDDRRSSGIAQTVEYGWGVSAGYRLVAGNGLTATAGGGIGRARYGLHPLFELGIGWTWWRHFRTTSPSSRLASAAGS